jgi:hypothetical protein
VLTALFDKFQGKTGQGGSAADFLLARKCQYKKEAVSAHGVGGQSNHPWDSDEDSEGSAAPLTRGDNTARTADTALKVVSKPCPRALAAGRATSGAVDNPRVTFLTRISPWSARKLWLQWRPMTRPWTADPKKRIAHFVKSFKREILNVV